MRAEELSTDVSHVVTETNIEQSDTNTEHLNRPLSDDVYEVEKIICKREHGLQWQHPSEVKRLFAANSWFF